VASVIHNLGELNRAKGDAKQSEAYFRRALAIKERYLGPDHPSVAGTLENLAALCRESGRKEEAKPLEERAAAIRSLYP
jgi:tetratricopeptide (TPR) repeat protein